MANKMDEIKKSLLNKKERLLWGARPGRDGTPYSYKNTETLLDIADARIEQHEETKKSTLLELGKYINKIEDRDDFKDLKPLGVITLILMEIERRTDALVSGDEQ